MSVFEACSLAKQSLGLLATTTALDVADDVLCLTMPEYSRRSPYVARALSMHQSRQLT